MTGQAGLRGLTDPAVHEVLDLCLECKACKSECPTNVDMARLKAEFLHQYYREHGLPWRNRVFGHVADLARWGCRLAPALELGDAGPRGALAERDAPRDRPPPPAPGLRRPDARRTPGSPRGEGVDFAMTDVLAQKFGKYSSKGDRCCQASHANS